MKNTFTVILFVMLFGNQYSFCQNLTKQQRVDLKALATNVHVDSTYKNGEWESVLKAVKNKRIVSLGEFNHGSKEVFISRNDLIKSLHQELGFDVFLFESGIGEVAPIDTFRNKMSPYQMTLGFFGAWRTDEFKDLMAYIKNNNISVGGFDVQRTGGTFERYLEIMATDLNMDTTTYIDLENRFTSVSSMLRSSKTLLDSVESITMKLIKDYEKLRQLLVAYQLSRNNNMLLICERTLSNRISYLQYSLNFRKENNWNKRWESRDSAMASNTEWLINTFYKTKKVIIISHNYHISKFNEKEEVMGEILKRKFGSDIYTVGVFAGSGSYYGNSGNEQTLIPADSAQLDIKHIINSLEPRINFIDIPYKSTKQNSWLFNKIIINDTFIDLTGSTTLVPAMYFDGILLIDKVSPPEMIKWN